jgi:hypothetical protein
MLNNIEDQDFATISQNPASNQYVDITGQFREMMNSIQEQNLQKLVKIL